MKKNYILLPLLAGLALVGCNKGPAPFSITGEIEEIAAITPVYSPEAVTFTAGGVAWSSAGNSLFGICNPQYNAVMAGEFHCMQMKKNGGCVFNTEALNGYTKITVTWYANYTSEEQKYWPVVTAGTEADALEAVAANETDASLTGVKASENEDSSGKFVYRYVNTFNVSGKTFFSIGASTASALYCGEIAFN